MPLISAQGVLAEITNAFQTAFFFSQFDELFPCVKKKVVKIFQNGCASCLAYLSARTSFRVGICCWRGKRLERLPGEAFFSPPVANFRTERHPATRFGILFLYLKREVQLNLNTPTKSFLFGNCY